MTEWLKSIPELPASDATLLSLSPVSEESRQEFWNSMISAPSDSFFDLTVSANNVTIAHNRR